MLYLLYIYRQCLIEFHVKYIFKFSGIKPRNTNWPLYIILSTDICDLII